MKTKLQFLYLLAVTVSLSSCLSEQDPSELSSNKGSFALSLNSGGIVVNAETRAALTASEAANYNIMVYQNDYELWGQKKKYKDIGPDYILSVGNGYSVFAESCSENEAETVNNGWGSVRYAGQSETFAIEASKTTPVTVNCTVTNGGLCVLFDKSFTDTFGRYSVEYGKEGDDRYLVFNGDNMATFNNATPKKRTGGAVAYFNMPPEVVAAAIAANDDNYGLEVPLVVHAKGAVNTNKTVLVKPGKVTCLTVYGPGATGDGTGGIDIEIQYDDDFDNVDHTVVIE